MTDEMKATEPIEQAAQSIQQLDSPSRKRSYSFYLSDLSDKLTTELRYPKSVDETVSQWVESVSRLESESMFNMEQTQDIDKFTLPQTAMSTGSVSRESSGLLPSPPTSAVTSVATSASSSKQPLVKKSYYREFNLAVNKIFLRVSFKEFPEHIIEVIDRIRNLDRTSPPPSSEEIRRDPRLCVLEMNGRVSDVKYYLTSKMFHSPGVQDKLSQVNDEPMLKRIVPNRDLENKVSTPKPDMLYGYRYKPEFNIMWDGGLANKRNQVYPFFVIECKGDGTGDRGSMWVATNQCLGGSVCCINLLERLNRRLDQCKSKDINLVESAAFSVATNGTEARIYISWKDDSGDHRHYYMQKVESFLLQDPAHYMKFRRYVKNIIDWGEGERFDMIQKALGVLREEEKREQSEIAKSRLIPLGTSSAPGKPETDEA